MLFSTVATVAMWLYAHDVNATMARAFASIESYGQEAGHERLTFAQAAHEFGGRFGHNGVHSFIRSLPRPPEPPGIAPSRQGRRSPLETTSQFVPFGLQRSNSPDGYARGFVQNVYVDGDLRVGSGLRAGFDQSRFGLIVAQVFGVRFTPPRPFYGGTAAFAPDALAFQNLALAALATIFGAALVVGMLAFAFGRYITAAAIRPLVDVTQSLQRFAARDFSPQAIALDGKSDFDVLARAFNGAAAQVAAAFAERDMAEAQMRQFVADAGHELRTPLTIVLGYIDLLKRRASDGDERAAFIFRSIAAEGGRMRTLIDNLVLLAKLESDDVQPPEPFSIADLVEAIVALRRELHPATTFDLDVRIDAMVIGRRDEMHEAVANIVDNAIKYAPDSPIGIVLDGHDRVVTLQIVDNGPGIPPNEQRAVFERFYRGASRGDVEGSGLGLAIAKRAIERAGGSIVLDPVAAGTRFTITLRSDQGVRTMNAKHGECVVPSLLRSP